MASETVDAIDWSHPPSYTGQYPLSSTYCTLQCGLQITRLAALSQPRTCEFRMPDQRTAGAATQGINCTTVHHSAVNTDIATTKGSNAHNLHKQNNTSYNTHTEGRHASTTPTVPRRTFTRHNTLVSTVMHTNVRHTLLIINQYPNS